MEKTGGWPKPLTGYVKLNVGADFYNDTLQAATILRNSKGNFYCGW